MINPTMTPEELRALPDREVDVLVAKALSYRCETFPAGTLPDAEHWYGPDGKVCGGRPLVLAKQEVTE